MPEGVRPTILVVDDEAQIRDLTSQALKRRGYHVLLAPDAPDAQRLSDTHEGPIHLLLTDIMLESGNGVALAKSILAKRPDTLVLYMSGFHSDAIQAVGGTGPDGGFLEKPFTVDALLDMVETLAPSGSPEKHMPARRLPGVAIPADPDAGPVLPHAEAVYRLESAVRCPHCREIVSTLRAVRLLRTQVNFTSTLPRRGRVLICPFCSVMVPAELSKF